MHYNCVIRASSNKWIDISDSFASYGTDLLNNLENVYCLILEKTIN